MSPNLISIEDLPTELSYDDAIEAVYGEDLDWIESKLRQRLSVRVECDKQLTLYFYRALRARLKRQDSTNSPMRLRLIAGHASPEDQESSMQTMMQRQLSQLQQAIFSGDNDQIVVMPHLDVLTTTTQSGLSAETREAAAMLYENPDAVFLAFKDPSFELPKVIENLFTVRHAMLGIARDRLRHLVLQREARKLGSREFNPYSLYKYFSGLNAIRCRQILSHFNSCVDFDPANPDSAEAIFQEIRQMTLVGAAELPQVDLAKDIGGYDDVKKQINQDILSLLHQKETTQDPRLIEHVEKIVPKGIILHGPPGTGKTFFAKAIATALDATVTIVSGPELKSRWVGESEENLRRVFAQARKSAPAIIVFDELDSFAAARGSYSGSGVEHSMVNQMLTEMDGFRSEEMVFVVGTTNFVESLDPALMRPGRFELAIHIPYPHAEDRRQILEIYRRKFELDLPDDVLDFLVSKTGGYVQASQGVRFSGDHLYAIARALKREQVRRGGTMTITEDDAAEAIGNRKKTPVKLLEKEERTIAIHESGHAILAYVLPNCPTIENVTIATGEEETLGYVMQKVADNKYVTTRAELLDDVCVLLGGRVAEFMMLDDVSVGSFNDLQRASEIGRVMVEELGMSEAGLRSLAGDERPQVSDSTTKQIDDAISRLLDEQSKRAEAKLKEYADKLELLVALLLEKKSVGLKEIQELFAGKSFKKEA